MNKHMKTKLTESKLRLFVDRRISDRELPAVPGP